MRVGLVAACDDANLFGVTLWPKQREILQVIERQDKRLFALALGRRSGKTYMSALVLTWLCLLRDDLQAFMRPGETRYAVGVAVNLRQARLLVSAARSIVERSPLLSPMLESPTEDELRFSNGTCLAAFPCTSRGIRGWPVCGLLMDEAAHFLSESEGPAVADRVFGALVPATAQFGAEARVILASTPWGSDGLFATVYHQAAEGELPDAQAFHATTREMNPTISDAYLAAEERRDPDTFQSEYLARFVGSGAAFLDPERLQAAVADRDELAPGLVTDCVAGLDPAWSSDPFGLTIVGRLQGAHDPERLHLALARSWRPGRRESFEERRLVEDELLAEVIRVCRDYRVRRVVTDQFAAPAIVDRLTRAGLHAEQIPATATSKTAAFSEMRSRLYLNTLELYDNGELIAELRRLRSKFSAGSASVVNPRVGGSHGDQAQALAMSVFAHSEAGAPPAAVAVTRPRTMQRYSTYSQSEFG
jgi:phage terminase large subunit-like protein